MPICLSKAILTLFHIIGQQIWRKLSVLADFKKEMADWQLNELHETKKISYRMAITDFMSLKKKLLFLCAIRTS
jgi:hypothetical protein